MMPQFQRVVLVVIVVGIQVTYSKELHDSERTVNNENNADNKYETAKLISESSDSLGALEPKQGDGSRQRKRNPYKREEQMIGEGYEPFINSKPKPKPKRRTIEAPYPKETQNPKGAPYPKEAPYPGEAPYPKEAPYPNYTNRRTFSSSNGQGKIHKAFVQPSSISNLPSAPLLATDIEIRRAVPYENDYLSRHYASRFRFPPAKLPRPKARKFGHQVISVPIVNVPELNVQHDENVETLSHLPPVKIVSPGINYQASEPFFQTPFFLPNAADESGLFRNPLEPTQTFLPSSPADQEPPGFVPWTPSENEYMREFDTVDHLVPGQAPSTGFNVEVSEISEPAFIVPENVGKVDITIPPPFAPLRTYALSINDAQITRNEVRKDNGEFLSSYTSSDGTERLDSGSLVPTADGDQVLVLKGSFSFTSPEGLRFRTDYTADETGYHATQVPIAEDEETP